MEGLKGGDDEEAAAPDTEQANANQEAVHFYNINEKEICGDDKVQPCFNLFPVNLSQTEKPSGKSNEEQTWWWWILAVLFILFEIGWMGSSQFTFCLVGMQIKSELASNSIMMNKPWDLSRGGFMESLQVRVG